MVCVKCSLESGLSVTEVVSELVLYADSTVQRASSKVPGFHLKGEKLRQTAA